MHRPIAFVLLMLAAPLAAARGTVVPRTGPEPSDIALALFAVAALWFVRRALRRRMKRD